MEIATLTYIASNMLPKSMHEDTAKVFKAFDIGGDGRLSKEDVSGGFLDYYGKVVDMADIETMFRVVDADQSGFIDYTEFMVATMDTGLLTQDEFLESAFNMYDQDKTGVISAKNIRDVFSSGEDAKSPEIIEKIIQQVDENGDGEIDFAEFVEMMRS